MRRDVLQRVAAAIAFVARSLEDVATALDDEELPPDDRRRIDGALRRGQREIDILQKSIASALSDRGPDDEPEITF